MKERKVRSESGIDLDGLEFRAVDAGRWDDLERLFMARGGPKYCWCMVWRPMTREDRRAGNDTKKAYLRSLARGGTPIGILGYDGDDPVAWCSVAPKTTFERLGDSPCSGGDVWSITCFFVPRVIRGLGITRRLISAAADYARSNGADVLEAYPVDPDSPSYKFMVIIGTFESMGFHEVGRVGKRRHMMRLDLR